MTDKKQKNRNMVFRIIILCAFIMGVRTIVNFITLMGGYEMLSSESLLDKAMGMTIDYGVLLFLSVVAFIASIISREYVDKKYFVTRTIALFVAIILTIYSLPAMTETTLVVSTRMSEFAFVKDVLTQDLLQYVVNRPHMYYTYMISVIILLVLSVTSVISMLKSNKIQYNN